MATMESKYETQSGPEVLRYYQQVRPGYNKILLRKYDPFMEVGTNYLPKKSPYPKYNFNWKTPFPIYDPREQRKYFQNVTDDYE